MVLSKVAIKDNDGEVIGAALRSKSSKIVMGYRRNRTWDTFVEGMIVWMGY